MIHKHKGKKKYKPDQGICNPEIRKLIDFFYRQFKSEKRVIL